MRKFSSIILCSCLLKLNVCAQVTLINTSYSNASYAIPALNHVPGAGTDRILIFIAANEYETPAAVQINSITYGGQAMTFAGNEQIYTASGNCWAEIEVYYLLEAGISSATSTAFNVNYSATSVSWRAIKQCAATFANVDQVNPLGQIKTNTNSTNLTIQTTTPITGNTNDMLVSIVSGGNDVNYSIAPAGFNNIYNKTGNSHTFAAFNRTLQCGVPVTPVVTSASYMNRQSLLAMVLQYNSPPPPISLSLGNDTTLCNDEALLLDATTPGVTYLWSNNTTDPTLTVTSGGVYSVEINNGCETVTDEIAVSYEDCDCGLYLPNCFTPNLDNVNETFFPAFNCSITEYSFIIFDRWGQKVFESTNAGESWKGTYKNGSREMPIGVYPYQLVYKLGREDTKEVTGHVSLIR